MAGDGDGDDDEGGGDGEAGGGDDGEEGGDDMVDDGEGDGDDVAWPAPQPATSKPISETPTARAPRFMRFTLSPGTEAVERLTPATQPTVHTRVLTAGTADRASLITWTAVSRCPIGNSGTDRGEQLSWLGRVAQGR